MSKDSCSFTSSSIFGIQSVLNFTHCNKRLVVSICFICNFLMTFDVQFLFICLFNICISSLLMCVQIFCPFFSPCLGLYFFPPGILALFSIFPLFCFWLCHTACRILVPQPGIKPAPPALEAWSLNHWTTREVSRILPIF